MVAPKTTLVMADPSDDLMMDVFDSMGGVGGGKARAAPCGSVGFQSHWIVNHVPLALHVCVSPCLCAHTLGIVDISG